MAQIVLNWSDMFDIQNNSEGGLTTKVVKYLTPDCREPIKKEEKDQAAFSPQVIAGIEVMTI